MNVICILAISGSLRASSNNTTLLRAMATLAPVHMEVTLYDGLADLPHFRPDLDGDAPPAAVKRLRELLAAADGALICTPEYAFGMPGVLKNALDWTVSSGEFSGKPVAAISASPLASGGDRAHAGLLLTLGALGAEVGQASVLVVPYVRTKLSAEGTVSDPHTARALAAVLHALEAAITARRLTEM